MDDFKITIVGLGLIGGSLALKLKDLGYNEIYGIDTNNETLKKAYELGVIKKTNKNPLSESDLVIICLYPKDTIEFIKSNSKRFKKGSLITDVSGVKNQSVKKIKKYLTEDILFISGHPMAGKEKPGFDNGDKNLFNGANYILISQDIKDKRLDRLKSIISEIGGNIIETDEEYHDKMIALTSQVPHILASVLTRINEFDDTKKFVGNSFDEMTRISLINEKLWSELFITNNVFLKEFLININKEISNFIEMIDTGDKISLEKVLLKTRDKRKEYLKS